MPFKLWQANQAKEARGRHYVLAAETRNKPSIISRASLLFQVTRTPELASHSIAAKELAEIWFESLALSLSHTTYSKRRVSDQASCSAIHILYVHKLLVVQRQQNTTIQS